MKNITANILFIFISQLLWAQHQEYKTLVAEGNMPSDFTTLSSNTHISTIFN